jgi:hypothetical protein
MVEDTKLAFSEMQNNLFSFSFSWTFMLIISLYLFVCYEQMIHDGQGWGRGATSRREKTVQFHRPAHNKPYFQLLYSLINIDN